VGANQYDERVRAGNQGLFKMKLARMMTAIPQRQKMIMLDDGRLNMIFKLEWSVFTK